MFRIVFSLTLALSIASVGAFALARGHDSVDVTSHVVAPKVTYTPSENSATGVAAPARFYSPRPDLAIKHVDTAPVVTPDVDAAAIPADATPAQIEEAPLRQVALPDAPTLGTKSTKNGLAPVSQTPSVETEIPEIARVAQNGVYR